VGFIVLFKWALKKRVMFLVGSNYINTEHNLRTFNCISEPNFNVLDLADFMMYH